ncbi:hypothetical protein CF319_g7671 [Tilletia indica]|nr:hypothetical protein CF319_g7671 [Tilletia indica]
MAASSTSSSSSSTPPAQSNNNTALPMTTSGGHSTSSEQGWICQNCGKIFAREDLLRRHLAREARALAQPALDRQKSCYECARSKARCDLEVPSCGRCRSKGKNCTYAPRSGNPNVRRARAQGILSITSEPASQSGSSSPALPPLSHFAHGAPHQHQHQHPHHHHHPQHQLDHIQSQPFYPHPPSTSSGSMPSLAQEFVPTTSHSVPPWPAQSPYMIPASHQQPNIHHHHHHHQPHPHHLQAGGPPHHHHQPQHPHQHFRHESIGGASGYESEENSIAPYVGPNDGTAAAPSNNGWLDALSHIRAHRTMSVSTTDSIHTSSTHGTTDAPQPPPEFGSSSSSMSHGSNYADYQQQPQQHPHQVGFVPPTRTDSPTSFAHPTDHYQQQQHSNSSGSSTSSSAVPHASYHPSAPVFPPPGSSTQQPYRRRTAGIVTDLDRSRAGYDERDEGEETPVAGPGLGGHRNSLGGGGGGGERYDEGSNGESAAEAGNNANGLAATAAALLRTRHALDPRTQSFSGPSGTGQQDAAAGSTAGGGGSAFQKSASVGMFDLAAFGSSNTNGGGGGGSGASLLSPSSHLRPNSGSTSAKLRNLPSLNTSDTIRNSGLGGGAAGAGGGGGGNAGPGLNTALRSAIFNSLNTADISRWLEEPVIASPLYRMGPSFTFSGEFGEPDPSLMGLDPQNLMGIGSMGQHQLGVPGAGDGVGITMGDVHVDSGANSLADMTAALSTVPSAESVGGHSVVGQPPQQEGSGYGGDAQMKGAFDSAPSSIGQHTSTDALPQQTEPLHQLPGEAIDAASDRPVINALQWWNITQASPSLPHAFVEDLARSCASHFLSYPALLVLADPTAPVPPFMHRAWLAFLRPHTPRALAVARVLLAGHHVRLPTSEDVVWTQIAGEVADLVRNAEGEIRAHREAQSMRLSLPAAVLGGGVSLPGGGEEENASGVPIATPEDERACLAFSSASALWFYIVLIILSDEPASGRHVSMDLLHAALCTLSEMAKVLAKRVQELDEVEKAWRAQEDGGKGRQEPRSQSMADKQARLYRFGYTETLRRTAFACYALLVLQRFRDGAAELQIRLGASAEIVLGLGLPAPAGVFEAGASPQWERAGDSVWETLKGKRDDDLGTAGEDSAVAGHRETGGGGDGSSEQQRPSPRGTELCARYTLRDVLDARAKAGASSSGTSGTGMCPRMAAYLEYADGFTHVCLAVALALDGDLAGAGGKDVMME